MKKLNFTAVTKQQIESEEISVVEKQQWRLQKTIIRNQGEHQSRLTVKGFFGRTFSICPTNRTQHHLQSPQKADSPYIKIFSKNLRTKTIPNLCRDCGLCVQ